MLLMIYVIDMRYLNLFILYSFLTIIMNCLFCIRSSLNITLFEYDMLMIMMILKEISLCSIGIAFLIISMALLKIHSLSFIIIYYN